MAKFSEVERMCIACREHHPKRELIRVVRSANGEVHIDPSKKSPGRGTYICNKPECVQTAQKKRALERGLKGKVDCEVYEQLKVLTAAGEGKA